MNAIKTIRQLANAQSSKPYVWNNKQAKGRAIKVAYYRTREDLMAFIVDVEALAIPGVEFRYADANNAITVFVPFSEEYNPK